jgi:la-related protein 6
VAYAVEKKSSKLEVNDLKTKVRRLEALPEYDETTPSRTVVVLNLPMERPTIEGNVFKIATFLVPLPMHLESNP